MVSWTDTRIDELKQLWADGLSASQCAAKLGGITRNAVCGKVDRLGLAGRAQTAKPRQPKPQHIPHRRRVNINPTRHASRGGQVQIIDMPEAIDLPPDTSPDACTLLELSDGQCRWPMGDPATPDFRFCGTKHDNCGPYCTRHTAIAYNPRPLRAVSTWGTR